MNLTKLFNRPRNQPARVRRLQFDSLEPRALLTGLLGTTLGTITETVAAPVETAVPDMVEEAAAVEEPAAAPLEEVASSFMDGQGPTLMYLNWYTDGIDYYFYGYVADDGDLSLATIHFGGIISGASTEVFSDGSFNFGIHLDDPCGEVTAVALDSDYNWSNQEIVFV